MHKERGGAAAEGGRPPLWWQREALPPLRGMGVEELVRHKVLNGSDFVPTLLQLRSNFVGSCVLVTHVSKCDVILLLCVRVFS